MISEDEPSDELRADAQDCSGAAHDTFNRPTPMRTNVRGLVQHRAVRLILWWTSPVWRRHVLVSAPGFATREFEIVTEAAVGRYVVRVPLVPREE